jgi:hypothetical protein
MPPKAWHKLARDMTLLGMESQLVIGLRMMRLMGGGTDAHTEAHRMVAEKVDQLARASLTIATGGTAQKVCTGYRRRVRANVRRLGKTR